MSKDKVYDQLSQEHQDSLNSIKNIDAMFRRLNSLEHRMKQAIVKAAKKDRDDKITYDVVSDDL